MKRLLTLLLLLGLSLIATRSQAQCSAVFSIDSDYTGFKFTAPGGYDSYHWDFGDGDTSNLQNPQYNYTVSQNYNVCLTVSDTATDSTAACSNQWCSDVQMTDCHLPANEIVIGYTYINSGRTVSFTNTTTSPHPPVAYRWNFSGGSPLNSTLVNPVVTLSEGGNPFTLLVNDAFGCQTFATGNVQINGNLPCIASVSATSVNGALGLYNFSDSLAIAGSSYYWNFGDGNSSSSVTPAHLYSTNGNYTVCMIVTNDSLHCSDSICTPVVIQACGAIADFIDTISGINGNRISFTSYSSSANQPLTYGWLFNTSGTSSTSTIANPVLQLTGSGILGISLRVTDSIGCVSLDSTNIQYGSTLSASFSGNVTGGGCPAEVYLILEDTIGHLTLVDSTGLRDSSGICLDGYSFTISTPGMYYVKAALQYGNPNYAAYLPTYYRDALSWINAAGIYVSSNQNNYVLIDLIAGVNTGGPGFVGGWVSQGAGLLVHGTGNDNAKSLGDPLNGVQINLTTESGQAVAYTFTDANGHYQFNNLAYGTYNLFAEQLNKIPSSINVTLSANDPADTSVNISINSNSAVATGIAGLNSISFNNVYPDPVVSGVRLIVSSTNETDATLKLVDIIGRTQLEEPVKLIAGENHFEINMSELAAGIYQLILQTGNKHVDYKLVKIK